GEERRGEERRGEGRRGESERGKLRFFLILKEGCGATLPVFQGGLLTKQKLPAGEEERRGEERKRENKRRARRRRKRGWENDSRKGKEKRGEGHLLGSRKDPRCVCITH